ncbi:MAG: glycosyltransferase [Phycisphaerae bacterium]
MNTVMGRTETDKLSVALLNAIDQGGGAEAVARMLRDGLRRGGHEAELWVGRLRGEAGATHTHAIPSTLAQRRTAQRYARKGFFNLGLPSSSSFCTSSALANVDIVHLHNLHGHYLSITALPLLARRAPLVWTFHDYFPITGGCAFPSDCQRWLTRCGSCPQLGEYPLVTKFDRTRRMQSIKRKVFRDLPVTIITPSEHLARAVRRSGVFTEADVRTIPPGVDTKLFHPERAQAREHWGLSPDRPVVLLVAQGLNDPRKGIDHAVTALQRVDVPGLVVLLVGAGDAGPIVGALARHEVRPLGYIADRRELAQCYAAADLFLFTSLAETFGCVVQEAMACGTTVLAFDIDGVAKEIVSQRTGFVVPTGDTDRLARAADKLLRNRQHLTSIGEAARRYAAAEWGVGQFIDRHERLYIEILARSGTAVS